MTAPVIRLVGTWNIDPAHPDIEAFDLRRAVSILLVMPTLRSFPGTPILRKRLLHWACARPHTDHAPYTPFEVMRAPAQF